MTLAIASDLMATLILDTALAPATEALRA